MSVIYEEDSLEDPSLENIAADRKKSNDDSDYDSADPGETTPLLGSTESTGRSKMGNGGASNHRNYLFDDMASKLKVQCPTCHGKGKLSQSQADSLVALIPVGDKRLKPRKTKLYIGATIAFAAIAIFLTAFFLLPRSLSVSISEVNTVSIHMDEVMPYIDITVTYGVKNGNFFKSTVKHLNTDIFWNNVLLYTQSDMSPFQVSGRNTKQSTFTLRQHYTGDTTTKVKLLCNTGWKWQLLQKFVTTASILYLSRTEQISHTDYFYVACYNASSTFKRTRPMGVSL